jgi:hypothetical protein
MTLEQRILGERGGTPPFIQEKLFLWVILLDSVGTLIKNEVS